MKKGKRLLCLAFIIVLLAQGLMPVPAQGTTATTDEVDFSLPGGTYDGPILVTMSSTTGKFCFRVPKHRKGSVQGLRKPLEDSHSRLLPNRGGRL